MFSEARAERDTAAGAADGRSGGVGVGGRPESDRLADRASRAAGEARAARASERGLREAAKVLGAGAVAAKLAGPYGVGAGLVLRGGALLAGAGSLQARQAAEMKEKQAAALQKAAEAARAKEAAAAKAKAEQKAREKAAAAKQARDPTGADRVTGGRGDTYGGRASEHDPGRRDSISRTC